MKSVIILPGKSNEYSTYKRLPLVVKAYRWHGWDSVDQFDNLVPMPYMRLACFLHRLYRKAGKIETDPRTMAFIKGETDPIKPGYWIVEHGKNCYEVMTHAEFKLQYQKCTFVSKKHADWMQPGIDYDSQDPVHKEEQMSHEEGILKASQYVCPTCNNRVDTTTPDWRFDDGIWQHYHGHRTGWIKTRKRL